MNRTEIYPFQRMDKEPRNHKKTRESLRLKMPEFKLASASTHVRQRLGQALSPANVLIALGAVIMARAFILSELLPYIYALIVAFGWKNRERCAVTLLFAAMGFATVLSGYPLWSNLITVLVLATVMHYVSIPAEKTWWGLPLLTMAVVFISKSTLLAIIGISFYQEMIIIFEALIAGVLTFALMVSSEVLRSRKPLTLFSFEEMASLVILGVGVVMGLNDVHVLSLSISSIICRLGILIAAYLWGSGAGTMVGVMAGIIPSITSNVFAQSLGMYAFSGLLAGLFKNFGRIGVIIGFMMGNLAISMFIAETQVALMGIWETAIASLIFFLLPEALKEKVVRAPLGDQKPSKASGETIDERVKASVGNRIHHLANVFDELSYTFTAAAQAEPHPRPIAYLNYLYDELTHGFCEGCNRHKLCWEEDYEKTAEQLLDIFTMAETEGQVNYDKCPSLFKSKCIHGRELISTVNYLFDNLRMSEYWSGKIDGARDLVAQQLKGVSQVVKNLAEEIDMETQVDYELRTSLLQACRRQGMPIRDITPIRTNGEEIILEFIAPACVDGTGCDGGIAPAISSLMGDKMEVTAKKCPLLRGQGTCEFSLRRAFNYSVHHAVAQVACQEVSGDSYVVTTLKEGKELLVLSDGMGVGEPASVQSQTAVKLLENMLNSGFDKEVALHTINTVLLLRSTTETFTTLDMVLIDLYTAEVDFIKTASAPSFIKRGQRVTMISSSSLPMGILRDVEVVSEKRYLHSSDFILMISDGVLETSLTVPGEEWIAQLLAELDEFEPQIMAQLIINEALRLTNGKPRDDLTAICIRIDRR
ncbi:MAG: stage II sporulation protein E [Syntrophomonadaceae bacterium]|nr:stage II sporulation protein E [Syntrophomonadaceae bacterium]